MSRIVAWLRAGWPACWIACCLNATAAGLVATSTGTVTLTMTGQTTWGGPQDEAASGVAADASGIYVAGTRLAQSYPGIVAKFPLTLGSAPTWSREWPATSGSYNNQFTGLALSGADLFLSAISYSQTIDSVGGKEVKALAARFAADGSPGTAVGGAIWASQAPTAPGAFPYGGIEFGTRIAVAQEAGGTYVYVAGLGEPAGFRTFWGTFLVKLDSSGQVLWSRNDASPVHTVGRPAVAAGGQAVFIATRIDPFGIGSAVPALRAYDVGGTLLWSRTSTQAGEYRAVTIAGAQVCAAGAADPVVAGPKYTVVDCWDFAGNPVWSRTYPADSALDQTHGIAATGGRLYVSGATAGALGSSRSAAVLEIDQASGNPLGLIRVSGAGDSAFHDLTIVGNRAYAAGQSAAAVGATTDVLVVAFDVGRSGGNRPPVANAGAPLRVSTGAAARLNGSASSDPDGDALTYAWTIRSKPAGSNATLTGESSATPTLTTDLAGAYVVQLTVRDPAGLSAAALVTVTAGSNQPPTAVISPVAPQVVPAALQLSGRGSLDPEGAELRYQWRVISSPSPLTTLSNSQTATPTLRMPAAGTYTVSLTVNDGAAFSAPALVAITAVAGVPPPGPVTPNCGPDQTVVGNDLAGFYKCNGVRISQFAFMTRTGLAIPTDLLDRFELRGNNSTAIWRFGEATGPTLAFTGRYAYYANCTRAPLASPVQITDIVFPPAAIEDLSITGRQVTANLCTLHAIPRCFPMRARTLPSCP